MKLPSVTHPGQMTPSRRLNERKDWDLSTKITRNAAGHLRRLSGYPAVRAYGPLAIRLTRRRYISSFHNVPSTVPVVGPSSPGRRGAATARCALPTL